MQALVYIFIGLIGLAIAVAAYFGLTFTPIEAFLAGILGSGMCVIALERTLRQRAEARFERAIEEFSRLLSTDAQAGQVLSQRINEITDRDYDGRMEALEADMSVLGTVTQQVAEAVAELEKRQERKRSAPEPRQFAVHERRDRDYGRTGYEHDDHEYENDHHNGHNGQGGVDHFQAGPTAGELQVVPDTMLTLQDVQRAVQRDQLVFHIQPIVTLPQRRTIAYDLLPRIEIEDGDYVDALDFTPRKGGDGVVQHIERQALEEAFTIVRRARGTGEVAMVNIPLSRATLADPSAVEGMLTELSEGRAGAKDVVFVITERQWRSFNAMERHALANIAELGAGLAIAAVNTLRLDFSDLAANGVTSVRADATRFINQPETYTDYHSEDIAAYIARYEIDLVMGGVRSEQQILSLLEDGVKFAFGPHIAAAAPMPSGFPLGASLSMPEKRVRLRS